MDPYFSSLAREVLYLHSLWYLGPPRNFNPNPNNNGNNNHINLRPCNPPIFKKESQKKNRRGGRSSRRGNKNAPIPEDGWPTEPIRRPEFAPVSEVEWPTEPIPEPEVGWPDSVRQTDSSFTRPVSAEEQENFKAFQLQNQALNASKNFFSRKFGSDSEDENFMEDVVDDDDDDDDDESEVFKFFLNLYTEDSELRNYFEKDYFEKKRQGGVFFCLVCGVRKKKLVKRYNNSVALVQHTASNSNTKQKTAHRAFGQVLCRVLGVEFNRLPKLVLSAGGPLFSDVSAQADEVGNEETGNKVVDSVNAEIAGGDQRKEVNGIAVNYAAGDVNGNSADCETGMKENDANNQRRGLDKEAEDYMGGNSEKIIDFNNSRKDGAGQQDQDIPKKIVNSVWEKLMKDGAGTQKQDLQKEVIAISHNHCASLLIFREHPFNDLQSTASMIQMATNNKEDPPDCSLNKPPFATQGVDELKEPWGMALPITTMNCVVYIRIMVSVLFLGRLGSLELAGGALSIGFTNITGYFVKLLIFVVKLLITKIGIYSLYSKQSLSY